MLVSISCNDAIGNSTVINYFLGQGVIQTDFTITTNEDKECGCIEPDDISTAIHFS